MIAAVQQTFRGVACRHCGKPVRLSNSLLRREADLNCGDTDSGQHLHTRVFPSRCRACHQEGIYALDEIVEFKTE
jgi:hypothetical protein